MAEVDVPMEEFYATPPVFKAKQWDGTDEGAQLIFRAIKLHTHHISAKVITYVDDGVRIIKHLEIRYGHDSEERMHEGDWVILHPGSGVQFLPDERFKQLYHPKES